jgi:hypothetical protein
MELTIIRMPALTNIRVWTIAAAAAAADCFMVVRKPKMPAKQTEQAQPINTCSVGTAAKVADVTAGK